MYKYIEMSQPLSLKLEFDSNSVKQLGDVKNDRYILKVNSNLSSFDVTVSSEPEYEAEEYIHTLFKKINNVYEVVATENTLSSIHTFSIESTLGEDYKITTSFTYLDDNYEGCVTLLVLSNIFNLRLNETSDFEPLDDRSTKVTKSNKRSQPRSNNATSNLNCDCSGFARSLNRSSKSREKTGKSRDIYVGDINITEMFGEEQIVIDNLLMCHNDKFVITITELPDEESLYPISIEINNRTDGTFYVYTASYYDNFIELYNNFTAGDYLITIRTLNSISNQLLQSYEFLVLAPNLISVKAIQECGKKCTNCYGGTADVHISAELNCKPLWCTSSTYYYRIISDKQIESIAQIQAQQPFELSQWIEFDIFDGVDVQLPAGNYLISVVQSCGSICNCSVVSCEVSTCLTICQPDPIRIKLCDSKLALDCYGDCDGKIEIVAVGGTYPYKYSLDILDKDDYVEHVSEQDSDVFEDLCAGCYRVYVSDANRCVTSLDVVITQPKPINLSLIKIKDRCGKHNGFRVYVSGGTPFGNCKKSTADCNDCYPPTSCAPKPCSNSGINTDLPLPNSYLYTWINVDEPQVVIGTESTITDLPEGLYRVIVKDSKCCCAVSDPVKIEASTAKLKLKVIKHCCDECTFTIEVCIDCGVGPYQYFVNGTAIDDDIGCYVFSNGKTFNLQVIDSKGAIGNATF